MWHGISAGNNILVSILYFLCLISSMKLGSDLTTNSTLDWTAITCSKLIINDHSYDEAWHSSTNHKNIPLWGNGYIEVCLIIKCASQLFNLLDGLPWALFTLYILSQWNTALGSPELFFTPGVPQNCFSPQGYPMVLSHCVPIIQGCMIQEYPGLHLPLLRSKGGYPQGMAICQGRQRVKQS